MIWRYQAEVVSVYDGDTITVNLDMGMRVWQKDVSIRLYGIDTPEIRGGTAATRAKAQAARDALRALIPKGKIVMVESHEFEKYGRLLATVYLLDEELEIVSGSLNDYMVDHGFAKPYLP